MVSIYLLVFSPTCYQFIFSYPCLEWIAYSLYYVESLLSFRYVTIEVCVYCCKFGFQLERLIVWVYGNCLAGNVLRRSSDLLHHRRGGGGGGGVVARCGSVGERARCAHARLRSRTRQSKFRAHRSLASHTCTI